nr:M23 family metallopeptidase [Desulfobulbaceae bacterium]
MKFIQYILVCLSIVFMFSVVHNNLIDDARSSVSLPIENYSNDQPTDSTTDVLAHQGFNQSQPLNATPELIATETQNSFKAIEGTLKQGDTFDSALRRDAIPQEIRSLIINSLSGILDFRRLKPFDTYSLSLNESGALEQFRYQSGPLNSVSISNSNGSYSVQKDAIELERRLVRISGKISTSLLGSFADTNEDLRLLYAFADIFASKIDFNTEVQKDDSYAFTVDKYFKNGELVGYGKIQSARYEFASGQVYDAYYYLPSNETSGLYFDHDGQAVGTSFLRSPLPMGRVTSKFSYQRKHPMSGRVQPHLGIDLAAPHGSPIMAVADGTVSFVGRNNGYGNQIVLAHNGGYKTYYGHLSRFKKGLRRGNLVQKKEIIGYVGSTGISTGPHLDFRIRHNNTYKNPFSIEFKPRLVLSEDQLQDFFTMKSKLVGLYDLNESSDQTEILHISHLTINSPDQLTLL